MSVIAFSTWIIYNLSVKEPDGEWQTKEVFLPPKDRQTNLEMLTESLELYEIVK